MASIQTGKTPLTSNQKLAAVAALLLIAMLVAVTTFSLSAKKSEPPGGGVASAEAVEPLTSGQIAANYGEKGNPEATDVQGNTIFAFDDEAAYETGKPSSFETAEQRAEAFRKYAPARVAAAKTANKVVLAVLNPKADQSLIAKLDGEALDWAVNTDGGKPAPLSRFLPNKEFRDKVTDVRYESYGQTMGHELTPEGTLVVSGVIEVSGTLRFDGQPKGFYFYADYSCDEKGNLRGLANFKLEIDEVVVTSDMVSLGK